MCKWWPAGRVKWWWGESFGVLGLLGGWLPVLALGCSLLFFSLAGLVLVNYFSATTVITCTTQL
jgi:hypothetical protein